MNRLPPPAAVGLTRARADQLLLGAILRAKSINEAPTTYRYAIKRLAVFGSYLSPVAVLGDLDLAIDLTYVPAAIAPNPYRDGFQAARALTGKCVVYIRQRCRLVHVHLMGEVEEFGYPHRVVFENPPYAMPSLLESE